MSKKRAVIISLIFIIAIFHSASHIVISGTGIAGLAESGISGLSIGKFSLEKDIKPIYKEISQTSLVILMLEWLLLLMLFISAIIRHRQSINENIKQGFSIQKYRAKTKTDLDILYEVLKEKKHLRISTISKIFNVDQEVALNWAKTLEAADLARIHYPRVGEPELTLNE